MSYQQERERFIDQMAREGLPHHITLALLRAATTLNRYAEMACSSEAADRDRVPCPAERDPLRGACLCDSAPTEGGRHEHVPRFRVAEDRLEKRIAAMLAVVEWSGSPDPTDPANYWIDDATGERVKAPNGAPTHQWQMNTQGDPRGYVLRVIPPSYAARNAGKDRNNLDVIGVPARESGIRW